jgi:hypothetical protein
MSPLSQHANTLPRLLSPNLNLPSGSPINTNPSEADPPAKPTDLMKGLRAKKKERRASLSVLPDARRDEHDRAFARACKGKVEDSLRGGFQTYLIGRSIGSAP